MHISFENLIIEHKNCCSKSKVASENGKRFEIKSNEDFTKIRIDDCLIQSQLTEKCDYGFVRHFNNDFYFVELKGTHLQKAFDQIVATIDYFQDNLILIPKEKRFGVIVSSRVPKAGISTNVLKQTFRKKYGAELEFKNREFVYKPK